MNLSPKKCGGNHKPATGALVVDVVVGTGDTPMATVLVGGVGNLLAVKATPNSSERPAGPSSRNPPKSIKGGSRFVLRSRSVVPESEFPAIPRPRRS